MMPKLVHKNVGRERVVRSHGGIEIEDSAATVFAPVDDDFDKFVWRRGSDLAQTFVVECQHVAFPAKGVVSGAQGRASVNPVRGPGNTAFFGGRVDGPNVEVAAMLFKRRYGEEEFRGALC